MTWNQKKCLLLPMICLICALTSGFGLPETQEQTQLEVTIEYPQEAEITTEPVAEDEVPVTEIETAETEAEEAETETEESEAAETEAVRGVRPACVTVFIRDVPEYTVYQIRDELYVPLRSFCSALNMGSVAVWDAESDTMTVTFTEHKQAEGKEHCLTATVGTFYLQMDQRVIYLGGNILEREGNLLVPMKPLCKAFGVTVEPREDGCIDLDMTNVTVCHCDEECYNEDDLYWLSRIIHAEAANQCMEGKIAVGNVVLNRVESERFPDTVENVIFVPGQFCPVTSGTIYCEPKDASVIAAKLCLEGVNFAGESTFFVNPNTGTTGWFERNLTYALTIQDHDFYY